MSGAPRGPPPLGPEDSDWWRDAAFYQVYVRPCADANGDGVGDLESGAADRDGGDYAGSRADPLGQYLPRICLDPAAPFPERQGPVEAAGHCRQATTHGLGIVLSG